MDALLLTVYLILSLAALVEVVLVAAQTWEHHRFARSRLGRLHLHRPVGRVLVIVPCKGLDHGIGRNLETLFRQDHPDYRIRFVVESESDPVCEVIERLRARHPWVESELLTAGRSEGCGQKVHNLRAATAALPDDVQYLAFVDSDARLRHQWLRALTAQLCHASVGAVTGYRWFVPESPTLANRLLYCMNSSIAIFLGLRPPTIVWGGSWAIRRDRFESLGIREAWRGTLSDDLVAGHVLRKAGHRVVFEPGCMVISPLDVSMRDAVWFARRQFFMGRVYVPGWMHLAFLLTLFANVMLFGSVAMIAACSVFKWFSPMIPLTVVACMLLVGAFSGLCRQDLACVYFPHLRDRLRRSRHFEVWAGPLISLVMCLAVGGAFIGRTVTWRGIVYTVDRNGRVASIRRCNEADADGRDASPTPSRVPAGEEREIAASSLASENSPC